MQTKPLVRPPQSRSARHCTQVPGLASAEVHSDGAGQPLPPVPRQPGTQALVAGLQIEPLVTPPQSASVTHCTQAPMDAVLEVQTTPAGQPLPPVPRHPSTQALVAVSHTLPLVDPPQSLSRTHWTQLPMAAVLEVHTVLTGQLLPSVPRHP